MTKNKVLALFFTLLSFYSLTQVKIGCVDSQRLLDTMPSRKIAIEKIIEHEKQLVNDLKDLQAEIQKMEKEYQEKVNDWTPVLRQSFEKKLQDKYNHFQTSQQSSQEELQAYGEELNAPILERLQNAVKIVAERQKLSMVLDKTSALYSATSLDITDAVAVELLNLEQASTQKQ